MDDKRCVICQQQAPDVFVTRYMGSYTSTIPSQEFANLKVLAGVRWLYYNLGHYNLYEPISLPWSTQ